MAWTTPTIASCRDRVLPGATFGYLSQPVLLALAGTGTTVGSSGWTIPIPGSCRDE